MSVAWRTRLLAVVALAVVSTGCAASVVTTSAPSAAPAGTQAGAAPGTVAPVGSWTTTISADDLHAAGFTESGFVRENVGTFTFTVDADGTWTQAQQTDPAPRWPVFRGTWAATGDDEFELRTTFPADYAGDVVTIGWLMEDENLRLQLVTPDDPVLRANLETHPWQPVR